MLTVYVIICSDTNRYLLILIISQVPPDPLGASQKVPKGHNKKGDTILFDSMIVEHKTYEW